MARKTSMLNNLFAFLNCLVNGNSCMYFELSKKIDLDVLQASVDILVRRHALLNCGFKSSMFSYRWSDDKPLDPVVVNHQKIEVGNRDAMIRHLTNNAWGERFDLAHERQLRVYYVEYNGGAVVQLVPNHILADGRAADLLMADLASIYHQLAANNCDVDDLAASVKCDYAESSVQLFAGHMSKGERLAYTMAALKNIVSDIFRPAHGIFVKKSSRGNTRVHVETVDDKLFVMMKSRLKANGFTVHPMLVSAVLRAIEEFNDSKGFKAESLRVSDMFSMLPFADQNLTGVYDCFVVPFTSYYTLKKNNLEMMNQVRDTVGRYKSGGIFEELFRQNIYALTGKFSPKKLATYLVIKYIAKSNVIISNPGRVKFDIPDMGNAEIVNYTSFSQLFPPAKIFFLFSSFKGALRLNILYDENAFDEGDVSNVIAKSFVRHLHQMSSALPEQDTNREAA